MGGVKSKSRTLKSKEEPARQGKSVRGDSTAKSGSAGKSKVNVKKSSR